MITIRHRAAAVSEIGYHWVITWENYESFVSPGEPSYVTTQLHHTEFGVSGSYVPSWGPPVNGNYDYWACFAIARCPIAYSEASRVSVNEKTAHPDILSIAHQRFRNNIM
eukprot:gene13103-biopygen325